MNDDRSLAPVAHGSALAHERSSTPTIAALIALVVAVVAYFALGMPGMDHSTADGMNMSSVNMPHRLLDPNGFARAIDDPTAVVINVHVPYDGEIEGTDLFVAYDAIDVSVLPESFDAPLAVYCRSGAMSAEAVATLSGLGYTNIVELDGGMNAWRSSGGTISTAADAD